VGFLFLDRHIFCNVLVCRYLAIFYKLFLSFFWCFDSILWFTIDFGDFVHKSLDWRHFNKIAHNFTLLQRSLRGRSGNLFGVRLCARSNFDTYVVLFDHAPNLI